MMSRMAYSSPMGTSGLGSAVVYGLRRTPRPPASIATCMAFLRMRRVRSPHEELDIPGPPRESAEEQEDERRHGGEEQLHHRVGTVAAGEDRRDVHEDHRGHAADDPREVPVPAEHEAEE